MNRARENIKNQIKANLESLKDNQEDLDNRHKMMPELSAAFKRAALEITQTYHNEIKTLEQVLKELSEWRSAVCKTFGQHLKQGACPQEKE